MNHISYWVRSLMALCMCAILCVLLASCFGKNVTKRDSDGYSVSLQKGFYRLVVEYREGDVDGDPNISRNPAEWSVCRKKGTIRIEIDGRNVQEKTIDELVINGSRDYCWNLALFDVEESGNVRFFFDGELAEFVKDRRISTLRFVK